MRTIYLLRHAQPEPLGPGRWFIGRTDLPLSPAGYRQAMRLRAYFAARPLSAVYHSGLTRTRETAQVLAPPGACICAEPLLQEINLGSWNGLSFAMVQEQYPAEFAQRGQDLADFRPPGGESFRDCAARAWAAFQRLAEQNAGDLALVAHAGINRCLLSQLLGRDLARLLELPQDYACLNILRQSADQSWQVEVQNLQATGEPL